FCRPHLSETRRLFLAYIVSAQFHTSFHAPPLELRRLENLTRSVHEINEGESFYVYGASLFASKRNPKNLVGFTVFSVATSYLTAYGIFVWCCVKISAALTSFGIRLSQKTISMQRAFLSMLLLQVRSAASAAIT
ncbi:hypothetical protein PFISCL1PPCAC_12624, partial [Pristionchus fissidentatus]